MSCCELSNHHHGGVLSAARCGMLDSTAGPELGSISVCRNQTLLRLNSRLHELCNLLRFRFSKNTRRRGRGCVVTYWKINFLQCPNAENRHQGWFRNLACRSQAAQPPDLLTIKEQSSKTRTTTRGRLRPHLSCAACRFHHQSAGPKAIVPAQAAVDSLTTTA